MSAVHATAPMANLSALGKALGQTSISSPGTEDVTSPTSLSLAAAPTRKAPKRERTDSMKTLNPAPAAQRVKSQGTGYEGMEDAPDDGGEEDAEDYEDDDDDEEEQSHHSGDGGVSDTSSSATDPVIKLPVKDRTGSAIAGVSRVTLISNAVKTAPPAKEKSNPRRWSKQEDESLRLAVERSGERNWKAIAEQVPGRNHTQCLQRWTKVLKPGLIKGHWDPEEDAKLRDLVAEGKRNWGQVASLIPGRTSKQCRERWCNHLDPNINKGVYTEEEDRIILEMQAKLGNRWSIIAQHLKGRTEDAVKIRWKSLMRGKKAAGKEQQQQQQQQQISSSAATPSMMNETDSVVTGATDVPASILQNSMPRGDDKTRSKPARTPTKQKTRAASPVSKAIEPIQFVPKSETATTVSMQQTVPQPQPIHIPQNGVAPVSVDTTTGKPLDSTQVAASINSYMQNVNDIVAASIQNFRLSQNYSPGVSVTDSTSSMPMQVASTAQMANVNMMTSNQSSMMSQSTISPMNQPVYTMTQPQGYPGMPTQHRQYGVHNTYQLQTNMQTSMGLPANYVIPTTGMPPNGSSMQHFPVNMGPTPTSGMQMQMGAYGQYPGGMVNDARLAMGAGGPGYPTSVPMQTPVGVPYPIVSQPYAIPQGIQSISVTPPHQAVSVPTSEPLAPVSASAIPPHVVSAASKLATPREEWGSSQTPRSHLIMTEGHASAYELFHQQRLRLMLKERDKGMSLTSAPSPGQAMLTKELKANKERQKRQEMMQKGWKSAVEAMMSLNNDMPSLDDNDNLMEKVGLSALDPTDDELLDTAVDITLPGVDETIVEGDDPVLIVDTE